MRTYYWLLVVFFFNGIAAAQQLQVVEDSVAIGATITLHCKVEGLGQADSLMLVWKKCDAFFKPETQLGQSPQVDIEVLDVDPAMVQLIGDTLVLKGSITHEKIKFRLFEVGTYCLMLGDSLLDKIKIIGHYPQGKEIEDIHPIEPFNDRSYTPFIYWLLVGIMLLAGIWYLRKFWLRNKAQNSHMADLPGSRSLTLERLNHVLLVLEKEGKPEWAVDEMTQALRNYMHFAFAIPAEEMTSDELISALKKSKPPIGHLAQVKEVLEKTDLYKFAKMPLGINELKAYTSACIEFVQKNPNQL
ncbi:MAG: hypothetical protein IPJ54_08935 [Saprospiraceae bacterium]|nr:hypothetical protein [Saprospiraceae bacterium]